MKVLRKFLVPGNLMRFYYLLSRLLRSARIKNVYRQLKMEINLEIGVSDYFERVLTIVYTGETCANFQPQAYKTWEIYPKKISHIFPPKKVFLHFRMTADQTVDHFPAPSSKNKKTHPEKICCTFPKKNSPHFGITAAQAIKWNISYTLGWLLIIHKITNFL